MRLPGVAPGEGQIRRLPLGWPSISHSWPPASQAGRVCSGIARTSQAQSEDSADPEDHAILNGTIGAQLRIRMRRHGVLNSATDVHGHPPWVVGSVPRELGRLVRAAAGPAARAKCAEAGDQVLWHHDDGAVAVLGPGRSRSR